MSKDFAQRGGGGRQARSGAPGWLWLLVGIAIGAVGVAGWMITRPTAPATEAAAADGKPAATGRKKIAIPPKEPSRFAFYELLPNYEVVIPRESVREAPARPAAGAGGTRYVLQVGSFRDRKEAEQQKASLALIGIESKVEQVTIDNDQTWYRVRIGPERDRARVENILARLEENQLGALVMQVPAE